MLKAQVGDGLFIFGLSARSIELLQEGKPLAATLDEFGMPGKKAIIMYGETEEAIAGEIQQTLIEIHNQQN